MIGGQACIIYGAAEFSRDSDFVLLDSAENLDSLRDALKDLESDLIYVPPLEVKYLAKGHACHFRCDREDVRGLRIDVMSRLRGCDPFDILWERRHAISLGNGSTIDIIGLKDLVKSKKTQRDKDWLMLKRLVNSDIIVSKYEAPKEHIKWWLQECRDAGMLIELVKAYPEIAQDNISRPLLKSAVSADIEDINKKLQGEEKLEREKDREYWAPLRKELEDLRHKQ
ncbi:MAG: hypothetical protein NTW09_01965 [Candidatus Omnitrophica bacterium]|nr:hypothetical protein [Candidatus Omnitrophota bacterium]